MNEKLYFPTNYQFRWTEDGFYYWHCNIAHKLARLERDTQIKKYHKDGLIVKPFVRKNQSVVVGGKSTGHPEVVLSCSVYGIKFL